MRLIDSGKYVACLIYGYIGNNWTIHQATRKAVSCWCVVFKMLNCKMIHIYYVHGSHRQMNTALVSMRIILCSVYGTQYGQKLQLHVNSANESIAKQYWIVGSHLSHLYFIINRTWCMNQFKIRHEPSPNSSRYGLYIRFEISLTY